MKGTQRRALVIDGDEPVRSICQEVLEVVGYEVDAVGSLDEGAEMLKAARYDLVVADAGDGVEEAIEGLLAEFPGLGGRLIALFPDAQAGRREITARSGARILEKPFRITELLSASEEVVLRPLIEHHSVEEAGKRRETRFEIHLRCYVLEEGDSPGERSLSAATGNISRGGAKAHYPGPPLEPGTAVGVYASMAGLSVYRRATVVWSVSEGAKRSASGLCFEKPMPVALMVNVVPAREIRCRKAG